jgi:DnaJ family protein B protein 12
MAFEGEVSPEDLFNMFFGGGGMGGNSPFGPGFGGGGPGTRSPLSHCRSSFTQTNIAGVFSASFGPGGFRATRMGGGGGGGGGGGAQRQENPSSMLVQLLPLLILVFFSLLNALPSLLSGPSYPDPAYTFSATSSYNMERSTRNLGIKYYVNEAQLNSHPVIGVELAQAPSDKGARAGKGIRQFEQAVEQKYTQQVGCMLLFWTTYSDANALYSSTVHVGGLQNARSAGENKRSGSWALVSVISLPVAGSHPAVL